MGKILHRRAQARLCSLLLYHNCADEDEDRTHSRKESRRLVKGGRERMGKSPRSRIAEPSVSNFGRPRYRPMSGRALRGNESGTAEVRAFVS